jgi:hypothetical protein
MLRQQRCAGGRTPLRFFVPSWIPDWATLEPIVAAGVVMISLVLGLVLALLTLPGVWFMLAVALGVSFWVPDLISTPVLIGATVIAVLGEIIEGVLSAAGSKKFGGSIAGALGSIAGGLIGALVGTFIPIPIIGTLFGAVVGAGLGAFGIERWYMKRTGKESMDSAKGAMLGRAIATFTKMIFAGIVALILLAAVLVPGW